MGEIQASHTPPMEKQLAEKMGAWKTSLSYRVPLGNNLQGGSGNKLREGISPGFFREASSTPSASQPSNVNRCPRVLEAQ